MKIQSLSIDVPIQNKCINHCKFCVSRLHKSSYESNYDFKKKAFKFNVYENDYLKRLKFARDNGCNTAILTGTGEPLQNKEFLSNFKKLNNKLSNPFLWIELQTSGVLLNNLNLGFLRSEIAVNTISLSISDIFNDENNANIVGIASKLKFNLDELCKNIKKFDFNLRLSLNLSDVYSKYLIEDIFKRIKELNADQVTFRKLYTNDAHNKIDKWINDHKLNEWYIENIEAYIKKNGRALNVLPFGAIKYSVDGISTVIDKDCMSEDIKDNFKYLILRENCKLYSDWSDKGSLIF